MKGARGAPAPPPRLQDGIRALVGASFVIAVGYGIIAPVLPTFARSFDVGIAAASAVISAFAVTRLVFAPASGYLIGRLGELRVFSGGLLIVGLSSAACAFAVSYPQLLIYRAVGGIGSTMFTVAAASLLIRISPPEMRGRAAGAWATGFLLGTIVGPVLGGVLAGWGPRAPFLIYAGLLAVTAAGTGRLLRGRDKTPSPDAVDAPVEVTVTFARALRHPAFRAALTSNFVHGWTVYGVRVALVPLLVVELLDQPSSVAGLALAAFATGTAATLLLGGRLADVHGRKPPILLGSSVVALTSLWLGYSASPAELLVASLLSGAGTGLVYPPVNAAVADVIAVNGGNAGGAAALAGYQMIGDVGAVVGPVLAGMAVEQGGYPAAFALTAAVAVVSFGCWLLAPETVPRPGPSPTSQLE